MIGSWKLPALAIAGLFGFVGFFCPACGRGGGAEEPAAPGSATVGSSPAAAATVETVEFDVAGMTCGGCATATEIALERLDGVGSAEASYDEGTGAGRAVVEYDASKVSIERMVAAVEAVGFHATPRTAKAAGA